MPQEIAPNKYRLSDAETQTLREALRNSEQTARLHGSTAKANEFANLARYAGQVKRITVQV